MLTQQQIRQVNYNSNDLWKSVLLVSTQGSKKGRGKRRGAGQAKDLNVGQTLGDGKLQVKWPGLNADVMNRERTASHGEVRKIKIIGIDEDREKKLTEIRNRMDKFRSVTVFPHERGFTSSSLNGKFIGPPASYNDVDFKDFDTCILDYKLMMSHKSKLGKKKVISCFVVTGNRKGILGYALGRSSTSAAAIAKAKEMASKNLLNFSLYEDRTLFHNFNEEYYFTRVYAEKVPKGHGLICHRVIKRICQLIGIKDIYAKIEGSRNPANVAKAFICGLLNQKTYREIANEKNLHLVEFKPEKSFFPEILASPDKSTPLSTTATTTADNKTTSPSSSSSIEAKNTASEEENLEEELSKYLAKCQHHEKENDLILYLFNNRFMLEKKNKPPFYAKYPSYLKYLELKQKDRLLRKSRVERIVSLTDEAVNTSKYPMVPKKIRWEAKEKERLRRKAIITQYNEAQQKQASSS